MSITLILFFITTLIQAALLPNLLEYLDFILKRYYYMTINAFLVKEQRSDCAKRFH